jgi:hypothetical protein
MRIQELLEGKKFDDLDFVTKENGKRSINFDLAEDLIHFMNQDDDVYRRHTYPAIANCLDKMSKKSKPNTNVFEPAVKESYKIYTRKYPIRDLPDEIDSKMCEQVCNKIHEEVLKHISDGKYKG